MHSRSILRVGVVVLALSMIVAPAAAQAPGPDVLVTNGSPTGPFAQNKQNEPALAVNPLNTDMLVAGSNDEIDLEACAAGDPTTCPFTQGVGLSGVYFSFDRGDSWTQPSYTGWTARDCLGSDACTPHEGPIGTLPLYYENGLVSDGDPSVAFGPQPGPGGFSWTNGVRLYYANLTSNFSSARREEAFRGAEAVAVSRTDDPQAAASGDTGAWMAPVIITRQNAALFSDKEQVWADNVSSSPFFGNVYVCNMAFRGLGASSNAVPEPVMFARSTDGGDTWAQRQISAATNNGQGFGRQGCSIRTDSHGVVYVFWEGGSVRPRGSAMFMRRSLDGGVSFEQPRQVASVIDVGKFDVASGSYTFDGDAGARTNSFPSVDIANGAPSGDGATDEIVLAWSDGPLDQERSLVSWSMDGGANWGGPVAAQETGDRPDFSAVAIAPDGSNLYLTYDAFLQPWQTTTIEPTPDARRGARRARRCGRRPRGLDDAAPGRDRRCPRLEHQRPGGRVPGRL